MSSTEEPIPPLQTPPGRHTDSFAPTSKTPFKPLNTIPPDARTPIPRARKQRKAPIFGIFFVLGAGIAVIGWFLFK